MCCGVVFRDAKEKETEFKNMKKNRNGSQMSIDWMEGNTWFVYVF
jgi:hypothetical protein